MTPVHGFENHYTVSDAGHVFRVGSTKPLSPSLSGPDGYLSVSLWVDGVPHRRYVHILVALTFHGPRPSKEHEAAHGDGVNTNNHRDNISWKTRVENAADKIAHGTTNRGERNGRSKLSDAQCEEIRTRYLAGENQPGLASCYGVSQPCISNIVRGVRMKVTA